MASRCAPSRCGRRLAPVLAQSSAAAGTSRRRAGRRDRRARRGQRRTPARLARRGPAPHRRRGRHGDGPGGPGPRAARGRRGPGRLIALGGARPSCSRSPGSRTRCSSRSRATAARRVRVTIPQGSSLSQIADRLERSGVIEDAGFFQLRARISGDSGNLRPGSYVFREDMSFAAAIAVLKEGVPPNVVQVSIPEGLSRKEIRPLTASGTDSSDRRRLRSTPATPRTHRMPGRCSLLPGQAHPPSAHRV